MVILLVTLGSFLFLELPFQLVVHLDPQSPRRWRLLLLKKIPQVVEYLGDSLYHEPLSEIVQVDEEVLSILISLVCREGEPVNRCFPAALNLIFFPQEIQLSQGVLRKLVSLLCRCSQPVEGKAISKTNN